MKSSKITLLLILFAVLLYGTEWRIPIHFRPTSLDTYYHYTYYFGEREGATDGYDPFIDVAIPIQPPEGFFPYFVGDTIGDTIMPYLREDYRSVADTGIGHIDYLWQLSFRDDTGESVWVIWDSDSFPYTPEYPLYMHFIVSETLPDSVDWLSATPITEQESIFVPIEQSVFFKYWDRTGIKDFSGFTNKMEVTSYPNPFNSFVRIEISIPAAYSSYKDNNMGGVNVAIYDIRGNIVKSFSHLENLSSQQSGWMSASFIWKPNVAISSGIYFVRAIGQVRSVICSKSILYIK